jgi:NAD(P)-dependent dehydrogenase (short-subunit alcohol dehydrogenase family)
MTRITTPFGFRTTAAEVAEGISLSGKRAIVTGASSGIGVETARVLASAGAEVTLAVRNPGAGSRVAADIAAATGNCNLHVMELDLAAPSSVAAFVAAWSGPLHILVNNAAVMGVPGQRTPQGWELQFATNHLGHFALTLGLHGALAAAGGARLVVLSSNGHLASPVVFEDIHYTRRPYHALQAYAQSKTANALFAVAAAARWAADGITANAVMPGSVPTGLQRHIGGMITPPERRKTVEQGAATSILMAMSPLVEGVSGRYFEDCNEAGPPARATMNGVAPHALDPAAAKRLWEESLRMIGR